ncbi:hypothetical protein MGU_09764 [Metarhizium guizhouense ARSEF 977]|uniref:Heat-labile enterotoxin IIA, A chain n=1 Tax=Metarhizium guizhouense (strain ARSEF 977) TaxID=1276136 RepID=A0A0B4GK47_METGA|nr:hypothetical protein MGU_09764 [Metarhizium guizhouense ARSEF 977]
MKLSLTLLTVLLGLGAAAPQDHSSIDGLNKNLKEQVKNTLAELEQQNKMNTGTVKEMAQQHAWQVTGQQPGKIRKGASILSLLATSDYTVTISFLPKVGALGSLPGFISILKTIAISIEKAQFPDITARREAEEKCFKENGRTYKDLCNYYKPHLTVSLLGRLNGCSDKEVVHRDAYVDHTRAEAFYRKGVLCNSYKKGGTPDIIDEAYRYDPLRAFWCKDKDEQLGLLLSESISEALRDSIHLLDYDEFRKQLEPSCKELLKGQFKNQCPIRDEIETANKEFPPYSYCLLGKIHNEEKLKDHPYKQDPQDPNLFVVSKTRMQYRKEGESGGV